MTLEGCVYVDRIETGFADAVLYATLEDARLADAASHVVARQETRGLAGKAGEPAVFTFRLVLHSFDPRARYVVRALVDLDGDGSIGVGDYVSTESFPVDTSQTRVGLSVRATRVE